MRYFFFVLLIGFSLNAVAQNSDKIIGNWTFHELGENDQLTKADKGMFEELFAGSKFEFTKKGKFTLELMGNKKSGSYEVQKSGKEIVMTGNDGKKETMSIIKIKKDLLTVGLGAKGALVMKRSGSKNEKKASKKSEYPTVETTKDAIAKKWYMQNKTTAKKGKVSRTVPVDEQDAAYKGLKSIMSSITFEMLPNGDFKSGGPSGEMKGDWKFGASNDIVILNTMGIETKYYVYQISDEELVLNQVRTDDFYFFALEPAE